MLLNTAGFSQQIAMGNETTMTVDIENTGQAPITIDTLEVDGLPSDQLWVHDYPRTIPAGETREAEVRVRLPADFCSYPCNRAPEINIQAEGTSADQQLTAESSIATRINVERPEQTSTTEPEQANETQEASFGGPTARMVQFTSRMTQNDMNVALGLILVFTVVLAAAIKRKKAQADQARGQQDERGNGGRPQLTPRENKISRPRVKASSSPDDATDKPSTDTGAADGQEDTVPEQEDGTYVCEATGETFDTKAALELYKEMNDIDE